MEVEGKAACGVGISAAGKPATVAAFAHISPLGAVGEHLVELRSAQPITAVAGQAFIFEDRRLLRLGLLRLDEEPILSRAGWPIARWGLPAMAKGEEPGRDFARCRQGSIGRFHSHTVYCLKAITLRRSAGISSAI